MITELPGIGSKLSLSLESSDYLSISVIIPCFRCARTINRAIDSIIKQTRKPAEVILVDDASEDGTLDVLRQIEQQYPDWITVITLQKNSGAASARNAGWAIATHLYIAFLDADDSWHPEKLGVQYEYLQSNLDVALCGHQCVFLRDGEALPILPNTQFVTKIRARSLLFKNSFNTPTVMLKRDTLFRFKDGKRCAEDLLLWQQIASSGLKVVRMEIPLAYVHKHLYGSGGLSAHLWKMECGELGNFLTLFRSGDINSLLYFTATIFSISKFIKRLIMVKLKNLMKLLLPNGGAV